MIAHPDEDGDIHTGVAGSSGEVQIVVRVRGARVLAAQT